MSTAEKEIQQLYFSNEWHKLRVNVLLTSNWIKNELKDFLESFDITQQQFNILRILRGAKGEPLSTNDICEKMIDKMSDTSRIVDRLISKDLVWKQPCPHDGRKVQVFISEHGMKLLSEIDSKMNHIDSAMARLSKKEAQQLNSLLDKLRP